MRKQITGLVVLLLSSAGLLGQEDCANWFPLKSGTELIHAWYDADGKVTDYSKRKVREVTSRGEEGTLVLVDLSAWTTNSDTLFRNSYLHQCKDGQLLSGLLSRLTPSMLRSIAHLDLKVSGNALILPESLDSLAQLPPSHATLIASENGQQLLNLDMDFKNVKVIDKEVLVTPAGSFDCTLISYEMVISNLARKQFQIREWYAPKVGMVRREIFDRRNQFDSYQELVRVVN